MAHKSQWVDVIESLTRKTKKVKFTTKEISDEARQLYKEGSLKSKADYPWFMSNYVSSALKNMAKAKTPKIGFAWKKAGTKGKTKIWYLINNPK